MRHVQHAADYGVHHQRADHASTGTSDRAQPRRRRASWPSGVEFLFKKYGVDPHPGTAPLTGRGKLEVESRRRGKPTLEDAAHSSSRPARAPSCCPASSPTATASSPTARRWSLPEVPKSLVVIGAGAIGIEFADFWNAFGVEVTVIECMPRILPIEDEEISASLTRALKKRA